MRVSTEFRKKKKSHFLTLQLRVTNVPSAPSLALKQEKIRGRLAHVEWSASRSLPTKSIDFDGLVLYFCSSVPPAWYRPTACAWWRKQRPHPGSSSIWNPGGVILSNTWAGTMHRVQITKTILGLSMKLPMCTSKVAEQTEEATLSFGKLSLYLSWHCHSYPG